MNIKLVKVKDALDKDKRVMIDGDDFGTVMRGWLRNGGHQWVYHGPLGSFGSPKLGMMKREIQRRYVEILKMYAA